MLTLSTSTRIFLASGVTDMRKGFNTLYALVKNRLEADPISGHLYCFCNRDHNRLKILYWDGTGFWICAKRLEKGTFRWPMDGGAGKELDSAQLLLLLGGLDLKQVQPRAWFGR